MLRATLGSHIGLNNDFACEEAKHLHNMVQGFITPDGMLSQGCSESLQSAALVILDGKYSFKYQTAGKARELKDSIPNMCS